MHTINRRHFFGSSLAGLAGYALLAGKAARVLGANDKVRFALVGCGGRGRYVSRGFIEQGAELTHLCDLNDERLDESEKFVAEVQPKKPARVKDMRAVFDSQEVDAVIVATPDHWHALATVRAVQAGKDVYVEKPNAYSPWESRKMVEAAEKYQRIVQVGTQNRSAPYNLAAAEYVKSGKLGKIGLVKVYNLKSGKDFKLGESGPVPAGFNWDAWLGPAPARPYHEKIFEHGWHMFWDYSGGDMVDDGIHQLDLAMMVLGDPGLPSRVTSIGGRKVYRDDREVPDVQEVAYDFEDRIVTFELTNYPRYMEKTTATMFRKDYLPYWTQNATRIELYGSEQMMMLGRHGGGWQVMISGGKIASQMFGQLVDPPHYANFLKCVKDRSRPNAAIAVAHNACVMAHMANIAHRVGNASLQFDAKTFQFVDHAAANALMKREYRKGYEPPAGV